MIGLMVVLLMSFSRMVYGFSSSGSWSYSREWVWNLGTELCNIASGK